MKWYHYLKILLPILTTFFIGYFFWDQLSSFMKLYSEELKNGTLVATIVGGFVAVVTLILIWIQLIIQNRQSKLARTYQISEKLQNTEFLTHLTIARLFFTDSSMTEAQKWKEYESGVKPEKAKHVYIALAYFEDIALLYNRNNIDRKLIKSILKNMILGYYKESEWFRNYQKEKEGKTIYKELDLMCKRLGSRS